MSQRRLVNGRGSIPLNDIGSENGLVNQGLDVRNEERRRKLTNISMGSDSGDERSKKMEDLEDQDSHIPKAQKLNEAVMTGNFEALSKLLEQKSTDINTPDSYGRAPLHNAILRSDVRMVDILLEANADINLKDDREDTPIHFAARSGNTKILKVLLSHPECDVNVKGSSLNSPLHLAATQNRPALCKLLVERGAKLEAQEENGKTPLGRAVESGAYDSAQYLFQHMFQEGKDIKEQLYDADFDGTTLLHLAVDSGFLEVVKLCVKYGSIIRQPRRKDRMTAFHLACEQGSAHIVNFFVEQDQTIAKILLIDAEITTPLHKTARNNSFEIAEILINNGADVNACDITNSTPLMAAAATGAAETVQLLMTKGADPTVKDVDGRTAVFKGIGRNGVTEILLQDPVLYPLLTEKDNSGHTVAHYAAMKNDVKSMALFLKHNKAVASVISDSLDSPLHVAAQYGNHEIVRELLEKQAGKLINAQNNRSRTALHLACRGGHYRAAMLLLKNSAGVEKDQQGKTPLHEAAKNGAKKVVEMIIEKHIHCLNNVDEDKNTALHLAVIHCRAPIITFLLSLNRQEILKNSSNQNILDAAMEIESPIGAMTIAEHPRWREVLESCTTGVTKIFKLMVTKMPEVAERFLDNCIEIEGDRTSQEYKMKYDLSILLRKGNPNDKSSLEILQHIADNRCENCLTHHVSFIALSEKWNSFGWIAFLLNIFIVLLYLIPVTVFHSNLKNNDLTYCRDRVNYTSTGSIVWLDGVDTCLRNHKDLQIYQITLVVVIVVLHLTVTLYHMYRQRLAWLTSATNIIELVAYLAAIISLVPTCECKWGTQKEAAAVALFFGWINLIMYLQRLPFYGKYVIMLYRMFMTLLKVLLLFGLFVFAFGTTFHQLLSQEPFDELATTMMNMFIMTLGEINYVDVFMPWNKLYYPFMSNVIVVMFCLTMPIILMNMLVGLSVGDIDKIEQTALIDRYVLQVSLLNSIENSLPFCLLKRLQKKVVTIYPNKRPIRTVIFDALIGFGKVEDIPSKDEEVEEFADSVKELHEKIEEQSHTIDEMKVMIKEMFALMKEMEKEKAAKAQKDSLVSSLPMATISGLRGSLGSALSFGFGSKKTDTDTDA